MIFRWPLDQAAARQVRPGLRGQRDQWVRQGHRDRLELPARCLDLRERLDLRVRPDLPDPLDPKAILD